MLAARSLGPLLLLCGLCAWPHAAAARPPAAAGQERATIQQILDGTELYIDARQARVKQQAKPPQVISTGNSRGQLGFASGAVGRINRDSELKLGSRCFLLDCGEVLISGKQSGCTRSARLSVHGTNYVLGLNAAGETILSVLEGSIGLEPLRDGQPVAAELSLVNGGQRLELSPQGQVLSLSRLQADDITALLAGPLFAGFTTPLTDQERLNRFLQQAYPEVQRSKPSAGRQDADTVARLRRMLEQVKQLNRDLDQRQGKASGLPQSQSQPPADPRTADWAGTSCGTAVQAYYTSLARVYRDWAAPKPSRKGRYVTRIDFDVLPALGGGLARGSNFEITQPSGEPPQDRSAYAEAIRKSRELPAPPACVGERLRVYHQFIVEYF